MRITHYLTLMWTSHGGVVRAALDLSNAMAARGHEVTLLTCDDRDVPPAWSRAEARPGVPSVVRLPMYSRVKLLGRPAMALVEETLASSDVLHIHAMWNPSNIQVAARARATGVPYIISPHGMLDDWCMTQRSLKKRVHLALAGSRMLANAAAVHCTAQAELDQSSRWLGGARGVVAPLMFDVTGFAPKPERAASEIPTLLFMGRLNYKKGPDVLLRAIAMLRDRGVHVKGVFAGEPDPPEYLARLHAIRDELKIADRVEFPGLVTGEARTRAYQYADLFVLPSSQENFGFVFFEALACGTPILTTPAVDLWRELQSSGAATIAPRDAGAFADAIESLIKDRGALRASGRRGVAWVREFLDEERLARHFEAMYAGAGERLSA